MTKSARQFLLFTTATILLSAHMMPVRAANWLMIQGTEPSDNASRARLWGFVQVQYQKDFSDASTTGVYVPPKLIGPNLESQSAFNVNRARIGVRGTGFPLDSNVNYFLLLEMGNNAITSATGSFAKMTDASITLNHFKDFARARVGLFKTPIAEEALQAIHVFDWINFSEATNQLLLERFPNKTYTGNVAAQTIPPSTSFNGFDRSVGAFRDVGVQLFNSFQVVNNWDLSYALMFGNGNGLNASDNDNHKDAYFYLSGEKVFGGKGPFRQMMKFFAWTQQGKRSYDGDNDGSIDTYERDRTGLGFKYLRNPWRVSAEYVDADGMIFQGPDKPSFGLVPPAAGVPTHAGNGLNGEAQGWYIEGGWKIPNSNWELDLRYDVLNRLEGQFEIEFQTVTLGVQYFFNKKTRATLNWALRDFEAVTFATGAGPNGNLDGVDDRVAIQLTHIF